MRQRSYTVVAGLSHRPAERVNGVDRLSRYRLEGPPDIRCDDEGLIDAVHNNNFESPVQICGRFPRNNARV